MMNLTELLKELARQGCYPAIIRRSEHVWRAHVNAAGSFWADAKTPPKALGEAVRMWQRSGKRMDGMAAVQEATDG